MTLVALNIIYMIYVIWMASFNTQHTEASTLVDRPKEELIERGFEQVETHDDRIREDVSKLLYFLSLTSRKSTETKSN